VDQSNLPRIIYTRIASGFDLRYTWLAQQEWRRTTIDTGAGDNYCGMEFDNNGDLHVSYLSNGNDYEDLNLKYGFLVNNVWHTEVVDTAGDTGMGTSIAFDLSGHPHISYSGNGKIYHAYKEDEWEIEVVDSLNPYSGGWTQTSIAIDSRNVINIVYAIRDSNIIRHAVKEGSGISYGDFEKKKENSNCILYQCYPNPSNPSTTMKIELRNASEIDLRIYNLRGQLIKNVYRGYLISGYHYFTWDGTDNRMAAVGSGTYFYVLSTDDGMLLSRKVILLH